MSDRAEKGGGKATPIEQGLIERIKSGVKYVVSGKPDDAWFGPQEPLKPVAPPDTAGRQFDYPAGYNLRITPRQEEAVSFGQMRALADGYDILRLVIETRKDQLAKLKWNIKHKDEKKKGGDEDPRIKEVKDFLKKPDKVHTFCDWLRMLIEDVLVIDAPVIYPRKTLGGKLYALEPVDGATIKRVIDRYGRTPIPPETAYQQILKGLPAIDYTSDELIYRARNLRTHKVYGYSPVEQVIMTVNIALRRQVNQLQYYTVGNVPDLIFRVPETWNPDQIKQFQEMWDALTSGQSKRMARFVPNGVDPIDTKALALKDEFDEWLARVICFCFSISPQAFIKQMNRATSETALEMALEEGLAPLMLWVKETLDLIIGEYFGYADIEFEWKDEKDLDPLKKSQADEIDVRNGIKSIDEVRAERGLQPIGMSNAIFTGTGAVLVDDILNPPDPPPAPEPGAAGQKKEDKPQGDLGKVEKAMLKKKAFKPINRNRRAVNKARKALRNTIEGFFEKAGKDIAHQVKTKFEKIGKADESEVDRILKELNIKEWEVLVDPTQKLLERIARDGAAEAILQIGMKNKEGITDLLNEKALQYAKDRAAEMVGMRWVDGELVANPNAEWAITEGTRTMLRGTVSQAIEEGWSPQHLADAIEGGLAFDEARALNIARTEIAMADIQGNMAAYRESGMVDRKEWVLGSEHDGGKAEDECDDNAGAGPIPIDEPFPSGDDSPPAHPGCVCDVLPVLADETETPE